MATRIIYHLSAPIPAGKHESSGMWLGPKSVSRGLKWSIADLALGCAMNGISRHFRGYASGLSIGMWHNCS